jgi:energy-dependent translational throttle protein EttA
MERALAHFPGAVIVVTHDRFFIDKVATRLLVFEEDGVPGHVREVSATGRFIRLCETGARGGP